MKGVVKVKDRQTGEIKTAVYAPNSKGNLRFCVDGKFLSDKQFDKKYTICQE